jgi:hypothetical protein
MIRIQSDLTDAVTHVPVLIRRQRMKHERSHPKLILPVLKPVQRQKLKQQQMKYAIEIQCLPVVVPFGYLSFLQYMRVSSALSFC